MPVALFFPCSAAAFTPEHLQCLETIACEYGQWDLKAENSYAVCQEWLGRLRNDPRHAKYANTFPIMVKQCHDGFRRGCAPLDALNDKECSASAKAGTSTKKRPGPGGRAVKSAGPQAPARKLTDREKKEDHDRYVASLMPTAEEERERVRRRDAEWAERERKEALTKAREKAQWENRPTAGRERLAAGLGDVQECLFRFRQESFDPPAAGFTAAGDCWSTLEAARTKRKEEGGKDLAGRLAACVGELERTGYPLTQHARENYPACEKELENAKLLAADLAKEKVSAKSREEGALKKCLAAFREESISLATDDLTTPEACQRRLAEGRERNEKTRKYKEDKAETQRLLDLIGKEKDLNKQIPLISGIPLEPFRNDELSRWKGEMKSLLDCLDGFKKRGAVVPASVGNEPGACLLALGNVEGGPAVAEEPVETAEERQARWDRELQARVDIEAQKRREAGEKDASPAVAAGEKGASPEPAGNKPENDGQDGLGTVTPAGLPPVDIKDFHILHGGAGHKKVKFLEGVTAELAKDERGFDYLVTVKWRYIDWNAPIHELNAMLGASHGIFIDVYSSYDRAGKLFKTQLASGAVPFVTYEGKEKSQVSASFAPSALKRKENHVWVRVLVVVGRAKEDSSEWRAEEWIYAGRIDK